MYSCSKNYRDACESGKIIYASFYRTLVMLNKVQLLNIDINQYLEKNLVQRFCLYGCNDITKLFLQYCEKHDHKPDFIIDSRPNRYECEYPDYAIQKPEDMIGKISDELVIVMSNYDFNEIATSLHSSGIPYSQIISIEELLSSLLEK